MDMNSENVAVSITGGIAIVPSDWTPVSATEALPEGSEWVGLLTEDGFEMTPTASTESINSWQRGAVRTITTEEYVEVGFGMIEENDTVHKIYYGKSAVNGVIDWKPSKRFKGAFILDALDTSDEENVKVIRFWIPNGEVMEAQAITFNKTSANTYSVTIRSHENKDGVLVRRFNADGTVVDEGAAQGAFAPETELENA